MIIVQFKTQKDSSVHAKKRRDFVGKSHLVDKQTLGLFYFKNSQIYYCLLLPILHDLSSNFSGQVPFALQNLTNFISPFLMKNLIYQILIIFTLSAISQAYLDVYIPECAHKIISGQIHQTLANFGYIPYGQTLIGQLFIPQAQKNSQLCTIEGEKSIKLPQEKAFMLVKRGKCKFTQKVLNAQKLGADMVIIYDNELSQFPNMLMQNDGHGHLVEIPSVYISGKMGEALLKALNECFQSVKLRQTFEVFETQIVSLQFWLSMGNRESYILLRDLYQNDYFKVIEESVDTSVRFNVNYGCQNLYCQEQDCIGSVQNQYCLPVPRHSDKREENNELVPGGELLKQSLRMFLLFDLLPSNKNYIWYEYMDLFDKNICFTVQDIEACSYETMHQIGVKTQVIESIKSLVNQTFTQINSSKFSQNNIFYKMQKESDMKNIVFYPQAVINGKNFYGLFKAEEVFQMICSSLISQPKQCVEFMRNQSFSEETINQKENLWLTVGVIFLLMTLGFLLALVMHSRIIKNEMGQRMSLQINKMVENYVSMVETKRNNREMNYQNDIDLANQGSTQRVDS